MRNILSVMLLNQYLENIIKVFNMDEYKKSLRSDIGKTKEYYEKSMMKTEQQKLLEKLLVYDEVFHQAKNIADIACGGGALSFHLAHINNASDFTLVDYMQESIEISKKNNRKFSDRFSFSQGDIYNLNYSDNCFDIVFCWQTLSWLENPKQALNELVRVVKSGGKIYLSSLFNFNHDVDIYSKVYDYTRESGKNGIATNYNTYSQFTVNKWLEHQVQSFKIHQFSTSVPFEYTGKGLGTYTKKSEDELMQISAGMLMNWGILEIKK